jgi:glycosyltransferase involved in cell wall biosynthesis
VIRRQDDAAARQAFSAWQRGTYDLAWFVRIESWLALGSLVAAPAVVDYDDLRDQLVRSRRRSAWPDPRGSVPVSSPARRWVRHRMSAADIRAWSRLQRRVARDVEAVIVCSELDRGRLGVPNAAVVPTGVELPAVAVGRDDPGAPPVLCLHGTLGYGPNADAATVLVRDVAPRVRAAFPDVEVRLVGRVDDRTARLGVVPGVVVTGYVADITTELARADVVAVPLREGAGTRIKVLEALAHRVPVVATSIAVEGLDVTPGVHLLVADEPDAFAAACVSLLRDRALRARLADAGERLVRDQHGWEHARSAVATLADRISRSTRPRGPVRPSR